MFYKHYRTLNKKQLRKREKSRSRIVKRVGEAAGSFLRKIAATGAVDGGSDLAQTAAVKAMRAIGYKRGGKVVRRRKH